MRFGEGVQVVSGNGLVFDAMERARAEGETLLPLCGVLILLPLVVYFRSLRRGWVVMLCLGVGLVGVLGVAEYFGRGLNLFALVPVLFTLGVAVDCGIYRGSEKQEARSRNQEG